MKAKGLQYKWVIVAICTLMVFACLGFGNSAKSLFVGPVSQALGVKRTVFSLSDTIRYLATAVANVFFGRLMLRFGAKKLILTGIGCVAAASVLFSKATNIYVFFTGSLLLGTGLAFTTTTMVGSVVNTWFDKNRGTVTGFVLASSGLGGAIATQLLSPMIFQEGNALGYKNAYMTTAILVAAVGILTLVFYRENDQNSLAAAGKSEKTTKRSFAWAGLDYAETVKRPYFYGAIGLIFLSGLALQGMSGSAATHIKDVGFSADFTAAMLSLSMIALAFSKFVTGVIYDRHGLRATVNCCATAGVVVMFLLAFLTHSPTGSVMAVAYAIINSLALPMETVLIPLYASDLFGERSFNKTIGIFAAANTAGFALGAPIINSCYDAFGSYCNGFILFGVIMMLVLAGFQLVIAAAHKEKQLGKGALS